MSFAENLVIKTGSALAGPLYAAWRRKSGRTEQNSRSLKELIACDERNTLAIHKIERDIITLAEGIIETLIPVFSIDGAQIADDQKEAIALAITDTFETGGAIPDIFLESDLDARLLAVYYVNISSSFTKDFSQRDVDFIHACIAEICSRLLSVSEQLPKFTPKFQREILVRQSLILSRGQEILAEIRSFTENNRKRSALIVDNFQLVYRQAVKRTFGFVHVFGLDLDGISTRLTLDVSYISLRAAESSFWVPEDDLVIDGNPSEGIKADELLMHEKRVLVLGPAGSGKTTLLQWLCTRVVERSLSGALEFLNSYTPFFIRLRDFYDKDFPTGNQLVTCASRALVAEVPKDWISDILMSGEALFLIDGVDEVSAAQKSTLWEWLNELIELSPESLFVITSRPAAAKDDDFGELEFAEFALKRMSPDEIRNFIEYWHRAISLNALEDGLSIDTRQKIFEVENILNQSTSLSLLATTPLLCAVICTLNLKGRLRVSTSRTELYRTAVRLLVHDRDTLKKVSDPIYDLLSYDEKERILSEIAYWLVRNDVVTMGHGELSEIVSKLLTSQQIERLKTGIADKKLSRPLTTQSEDISYLITEALVVRSGILQQITVGEIEFLHKTFQEFLASIAVRWHDDEAHLIKDFDLRRWNELVILTVTSTTRAKAAKMLDLLLMRGRHLDRNEGAYYFLLAASCLRETHGLSEALQRRIVGTLKGIVPPADELVVSLLAGAGDLVLPLLEFKESFSSTEIKYVLDTFVLIDTIESRNAIIEYLVKAECTDNLITSALEAVEYVDHCEFSKSVVEKLIARNSRRFFYRSENGTSRFRAAGSSVRFIEEFLPPFSILLLDGIHDSEIMRVFGEFEDRFEGTDVSAIRHLSLVNLPDVGTSECLRICRNITTLYLGHIGWMQDLNALSSMDRLRNIYLVNVKGISDLEGFRYTAQLGNVYLSGVSLGIVEAVFQYTIQNKCTIWISEPLFQRAKTLEEEFPLEAFPSDRLRVWSRSNLHGRAHQSIIA